MITKSNCPSTCVPKLKYFGINNDAIDHFDYNDDTSIKSIFIKNDAFVKPVITIQDNKVLYYSKILDKYMNFDSDYYDNINISVVTDDFYKDNPDAELSITLSPINCQKPMILGDVKLYFTKDYILKSVESSSCKLKNVTELLFQPISNNISNFINKNLELIDPTINPSNPENDYICNKGLYYLIHKDSVFDIKYNYDKKTINSIIINECTTETKPFLSLHDGVIKYLDQSGNYVNYNSTNYNNVKASAYELSDIAGEGGEPYFVIRISPENNDKPMIFDNSVIYPLQNYAILNVSEDGTHIETYQIPNTLASFLQ
jgi:hypothetical protein